MGRGSWQDEGLGSSVVVVSSRAPEDDELEDDELEDDDDSTTVSPSPVLTSPPSSGPVLVHPSRATRDTTNPQTTTHERIATTNELSVFKDELSTRTVRDSNESITMASTSVPDDTPTADELA